MIRLIVTIDDVNDNPPMFADTQTVSFIVPSDARANFVVGRVTVRNAAKGFGQLLKQMKMILNAQKARIRMCYNL